MTITISASGISLDGPLVAGEVVAVTVSGLSIAAEDKPTLALLARFPDALLASVELAEDAQTPGVWAGELDTATKQTALFFATARADERRDAALELVSGRVSIARLTVPMANSALCPKPDGSPFASPVYVPVPGPPGQGGDPYDQAPQMDGEASAGVSDEYARGDHRHPTDTTRQAVIEDLAAIRYGAAAGATAVQPSALSAYRTAAAQDAIDAGKLDATGLTNNHGQLVAGDFITGYSYSFPGGKYISAPENHGAALTDEDITDSGSALGAALAAKADTADIPSASSSAPAMDGVAAAGSSTDYARADHVHPTDTSRAASASLAPAFSPSSTYAVGDYCTHEGLLYKCATAVSTAGAWNAANWTAVAVTDEMGADTPLPFDAECEYVASPANGGCGIEPPYYYYTSGSYDLTVEAYIPAGSNSSDCFAIGAWKNNNCVCLFATSATAVQLRYGSTNYNGTYATDTWQTIGIVGTTVYYGSSEGTFTRSSFSDTTSSVGVGFGNNIRIRRIKLTYKGADIFDGRPVRVGQIGAMYDVVSGKIFYSTSANNLVPGPDKATPTITTPGRIVELTPAIRYSFASPTPTVSGTSATVACEDRAINDITVATGITSLTITPPAAVTGRARDFFCRVTLTDSSLPTVTLSGGTIDIGSTEVAGMTQGVNLLMFTEISSGHWLASRRSAS